MANPSIPIITIDGPGGAGKGTVSLLIANELGWNLLDSGALYRALAYYAIEQGEDLQNEESLAKLALSLPIKFVKANPTSPYQDIYLNNRSVTTNIRTESCGKITSQISRLPKVREALLASQRAFVKAPGLVADGRDMGTVVFPNATFKFFLEANVKERANRRYMQLKTDGLDVNLDTIIEEISARDLQDRERVVSPMKPASGAIVIDTTNMGIEAVFAEIMSKIKL